jgi:hypothetical protein
VYRIAQNVKRINQQNKTIQAWKKAATEAGLVLEFPMDFPKQPAGQLQRLRRLDGIAKGEVKKVITAMFRQKVHSKDKDGAPITKEYLTYNGQFETQDYRGVPYSMSWEEGKYFKPNVIFNSNVKYSPDTGQPLGNEKTLAGQTPIYDIELPKEMTAIKKFIDSIIDSTGTHKENIKFYYKELNVQNISGNRDGTLSYDDFVNSSMDQLRQMSGRGGGSKTSGYWRDKEGKMHDRDGNLL